MNESEIIESNKLIAKFMNYDYLDDFNYPENNETGWYNDNGEYICRELKFHSSWDQLIPVVEKIEKIDGYYVQIEETSCYVYDVNTFDDEQCDSIISIDAETKKMAVYRAVVEFIKFYNKQKSK